MKKLRKAFTVTETILGLMVLGVIIGAIIVSQQTRSFEKSHKEAFIVADNIQGAVKASFEDMVTYIKNEGGIGDSNNNDNKLFPYVKPLPYLAKDDSNIYLYYVVPKRDFKRLKARITSNFAKTYCYYYKPTFYSGLKGVNSNNEAVVLKCTKLSNIVATLNKKNYYATKSGTSLVYNPLYEPTFTLSIRAKSVGGKDYTITKKFNLSDIYQRYRNITVKQYQNIGDILKNFHNIRLVDEVDNLFPDGLYAVDDRAIPWIWQVQQGQDLYRLCKLDTNTNECSKKSGEKLSWWDGKLTTYYNPFNDMENVLLALKGEKSLMHDGFGFRIALIRITNYVRGAGDLWNARYYKSPDYPKLDYEKSRGYTSAIFNPFCGTTKENQTRLYSYSHRMLPQYCRYYVTY